MTKITQEQKVIQHLQECFHQKREFTHRKIARDTNVSIYLVQKVIRRLRREGIIKTTGGKGIMGDALRFKVVRSPMSNLNP